MAPENCVHAVLFISFVVTTLCAATDGCSLMQMTSDLAHGHEPELALSSVGSTMQGEMQQEMPLPDWEHGSTAWKAARAAVEGKRRRLWDQPNACDSDVLHSSAPLTVVFSLSAFWQEIKARRASIGSTNKPLEIHVVGASYPFEGRSDWSLLSRSKPPGLPGIRVALVLGTPFQSDNVPPMGDGVTPSMLESTRKNKRRKKTQGGTWSLEQYQILCKGKGFWGTRELDKNWSKAKLCRKHGNGLEVLCLEEYYQEAKKKLPRPDLVVLFSPGFPQLERRTWDVELRWMLKDDVPILVSDVVFSPEWGRTMLQSGRPVPHGGRWNVGKHDGGDNAGEPEMTLSTMRIYGARTLGAFRAPFPILHREDGQVMAKNAVVQMFRGYKPGLKPVAPPSAEEITAAKTVLDEADWEKLGVWAGLENALYTPVSAAYDTASQEHYASVIRSWVDPETISSLSRAERDQCEELGLCDEEEHEDGHQQPTRRWSIKDWVFCLKLVSIDLWL